MKKKYFIDTNQFINLKLKEAAYFLGYFWADGYLGTSKMYTLNLQILLSDFKAVEPVFDILGTWGKFFRQPKNRQKQGIYYVSNKLLKEFLLTKNYGNRNLGPILDFIPKHLLKYWYRGYLDGDGNIYIKNSTVQLCFASSLNQNWDFIEILAKQLEVFHYKVNRYIRPNGNKFSTIRTSSRPDTLKILNYIYENYDGIGLSRKYEKYIQIYNKIPLKTGPKPKLVII